VSARSEVLWFRRNCGTADQALLKTLAQGVDPTTGEVFPPDSPYIHPIVIRALFTISDLARSARNPKMSVEEKRRENLDHGMPGNAGLPWTDDARKHVASQYQDGKTIEELASILERTRGGIRAELIKQELLSPDFR
jgi:hypothetical protein